MAKFAKNGPKKVQNGLKLSILRGFIGFLLNLGRVTILFCKSRGVLIKLPVSVGRTFPTSNLYVESGFCSLVNDMPEEIYRVSEISQ